MRDCHEENIFGMRVYRYHIYMVAFSSYSTIHILWVQNDESYGCAFEKNTTDVKSYASKDKIHL
jgi:hypothetical protein